jgi:hypothetical protein
MSTVYDNSGQSRSSSATNVPDLEKGEVRPEKEAEELAEDKVSL